MLYCEFTVCTVLSQLNCKSQCSTVQDNAALWHLNSLLSCENAPLCQDNVALWNHSSTVALQYSKVTSQFSFVPSQCCKWHQSSIMVFYGDKPMLPGDIIAACANTMFYYDITAPLWHQDVPRWHHSVPRCHHCSSWLLGVQLWDHNGTLWPHSFVVPSQCSIVTSQCLFVPTQGCMWHHKYNVISKWSVVTSQCCISRQ